MSERELVALIRETVQERKMYTVFVDERDFCSVLLRQAGTLSEIETFLDTVYHNTYDTHSFSSVFNAVKNIQDVIQTAKGE